MKNATTLLAAGLLLALAATSASAITIDGTADAGYGAAASIQTTQTQFGDANIGLVNFANGSELDAAYAKIESGVLYLHLAGNLETNFNKLEIFFNAVGGGQNVLRNDNPNVDFNGLNRMAGLTFDVGFTADYYVTVTNGDIGGGTHALFANYAELLTGGGGAGYYLGQGSAASGGALSGGTNPNNILITIDNGTTGGVDGGCGASSGAGVVKGVELAIPLAALGGATCLDIVAFVNGGGHDFLSNQVLGPLPAGTCNLGEPSLVNFANQTGAQFFSVCTATPTRSTSWGAVKSIYR